MTNPRICAICRDELIDNERVIFSHRETFVFKPADVKDEPVIKERKDGTLQEVNAAAVLTPQELAKRRAEDPANRRTAVVNTFVDWGKAEIPADAFNFRHQWCEPVPTGSGANGALMNRHAIRFMRTQARGKVRGGQY